MNDAAESQPELVCPDTTYFANDVDIFSLGLSVHGRKRNMGHVCGFIPRKLDTSDSLRRFHSSHDLHRALHSTIDSSENGSCLPGACSKT